VGEQVADRDRLRCGPVGVVGKDVDQPRVEAEAPLLDELADGDCGELLVHRPDVEARVRRVGHRPRLVGVAERRRVDDLVAPRHEDGAREVVTVGREADAPVDGGRELARRQNGVDLRPGVRGGDRDGEDAGQQARLVGGDEIEARRASVGGRHDEARATRPWGDRHQPDPTARREGAQDPGRLVARQHRRGRQSCAQEAVPGGGVAVGGLHEGVDERPVLPRQRRALVGRGRDLRLDRPDRTHRQRQ
jgi:hypothetical protein